jgi:hypothetical protein
MPVLVSFPMFDSSMPPMAKTGVSGPAALVTLATPSGPMTSFSGFSGVANAGPQPM